MIRHFPGLFEKGGGILATIGAAMLGALGDNLTAAVAAAAIAAGVVGAIVGARQRGTNQALKDAGYAWREERDAEQAKADRLTRDNAELTSKLHRSEDELRARPDVSEIVKEVRAGNHELVKALAANTEAVRFLAGRLDVTN